VPRWVILPDALHCASWLPLTRLAQTRPVVGTAVQAQYRGPPPGYGPPDGIPGSGPGNSGGFGSSDGSFRGGPDFGVNKATSYRTVHGILAAVAFAILFPIGAMTMRLVPGRAALWLHALTQLVAYVSFTAAVGLGIWLVREVRIPAAGGSLVRISVRPGFLGLASVTYSVSQYS